ncbi:MAG: rhomboid family intrarane serine protease [Phycisphaerales bacterium]|nr:rhomboid family intrarane serine protease [Phycisphaerales bacterium]
MFSVRCECGNSIDVDEAQVNTPLACAKCRREIVCACAEEPGTFNGAGDFDGVVFIKAGPTGKGRIIPLGGCAPIEIGKNAANRIVLPGELVSRSHCKLVRLDFGPSRWTLEDKQSTNGLFVNGQRITSHELQDGDVIDIGEYELHYKLAAAAPVPDPEPELEVTEVAIAAPPPVARRTFQVRPAPSVPTGPGPICPSCDNQLAGGAKICVSCGIHVNTGRPLLTSEGLDENTVYGNAETALKFVSWIVWVTPLPIPLASAAYGKHKPYAIWTISAITIVVSLLVFFACFSFDDQSEPQWAKSLMLWPTHVDLAALTDQISKKVDESDDGAMIGRKRPAPRGIDSERLSKEELYALLASRTGEFHWWQLFTHALLHDPGSVIGFILHLGGNMLFMIVFGSRVNAIIGNVATAIVYPLLAAAAAAAVYLWTLPADHIGAMLGASGAINGLAGMYLVLFPAHRVYCAMWFRFRLWLAMKIFPMRGFWLLLIYFAYDAVMVLIGASGGVAHWAHIGGFVTGVAIGLGFLMSRQINCSNGDLLSLALGKHAWPLIGKPSRWAVKPVPVAS